MDTSVEGGGGMGEDEFRELFDAHVGDVWRFARRRCPSATDADDATAEVFAVAWRRRADLPTDGGARLWLFGTTRLVLANQRRGERRRVGLGVRLTREPGPIGPPDPAEVAAAGDEVAGLWAALASLTDEDRDLLIMRAWDGLPVADIARLLGCTPNAASLRLHKARHRLADALVSMSGSAPAVDPGANPAIRTDPPPSRTSPGRAPELRGDLR